MSKLTIAAKLLVCLVLLLHTASAQDLSTPPRNNTVHHCLNYIWSPVHRLHVCSTCATGFFLDGPGLNCFECPAGCARCTSATECLECQGGFFMKYSRCVKCLPGCWECTNEETCRKCRSGHYLADQGKACDRCGVENCSKCTNASDCQECAGFYTLGTDAQTGKTTCTFDSNSAIFWIP